MQPLEPPVPIFFASVSAGRIQPDAKTGFAVRLAFALAVAVPLLAPGMASAQISNPPQPPQEIVVFPERDFISAAGFAPNADVRVQLRRNVNGVNTMISEAVGRTDALGFLEVNHPGGVCWGTVTPDIVPADVVRVTYRDTRNNQSLVPVPFAGTGAATTTQNVTATQAIVVGDTVVIKGRAVKAAATGFR